MNKGLTTILAWLGDEPVTPQDAAKKVQRALEDAEICTACFRPHRTYLVAVLCCESCNYQRGHDCHFCGDWLGHFGVSDCYEKCGTCDHIGHEHYSGACRECEQAGAACVTPTFRTGRDWLIRELDRLPALHWSLLHAIAADSKTEQETRPAEVISIGWASSGQAPLPPGAYRARYHGSLVEHHGPATVIGTDHDLSVVPCGPVTWRLVTDAGAVLRGVHPDSFTPEWAADAYGAR